MVQVIPAHFVQLTVLFVQEGHYFYLFKAGGFLRPMHFHLNYSHVLSLILHYVALDGMLHLVLVKPRAAAFHFVALHVLVVQKVTFRLLAIAHNVQSSV